MGECELDWSGSGLGRVTGTFERGTEGSDTPRMSEISWLAHQTLVLRRAQPRGNMWLVNYSFIYLFS